MKMTDISDAKELIKNTPISSIIQNYIAINRKGQNYEAVCPFHSDSHPSLKINDNKGIYKCFACGAAGDGIKFVQDKLNLSFIDAIKEIANQLGIQVEEQKTHNPKIEIALRTLKAANRIYQKVALDLKPEAFTKFIKERNLSEESIKDFQIGFAPQKNSLLTYLQSIKTKEKNQAINSALELGLIREGRNKEHYDFFRQRITFPIWDHSGKVRGFSSRIVFEHQKPKYLNSGESFIFDKKNILYGFHLAKSYIRKTDQVIIAEGNMDVVILHQYGFKNSVAIMGTALSEQSAKTLKNMTSNIYLAMDSDNAGMESMKRANSIFLGLGVAPKYLDFSPAKDPDEYLQKFGRLKLQELLENAPLFVDQLSESLQKENKTTDQKLRALNQVFSIFGDAKNNLWAQEKVLEFARKLGVNSSSEDILAEFKSSKNNTPQTNKVHKPAHAPVMEVPHNDNQYIEEQQIQAPLSEASTNLRKVDKNLLTTFLMNPEIVEAPQISEILDLIGHFEVKRIVQWLQSIYLEIDESDYTSFLKEKMQEGIPKEVNEVIASVIFNFKTDQKLSKEIIDRLLNDYKRRLEMEKLLMQKDQLKKRRSTSHSNEESLEYLKQIQELEIKISSLKK